MHISEEDYRNACRPRIENLSDAARQETDPFHNDQKDWAEEALSEFNETGNFSELFAKMAYMQFQSMGYDELAAKVNVLKHTLQGYDEVLTSYNLSDITREKLVLERDDAQRRYDLYKTRLKQ